MWTEIQDINLEGWKLVHWDGGFSTPEGLYLETPDRVRIQIFTSEGNKRKVTFGIDNIPADVVRFVKHHYDSGYIEVGRKAIGRWDIITAFRQGIRRTYVESITTAFCDSPIQYDDGTIAYDKPNAIPAHVKLAVARTFKKPISKLRA